MTAVLDSWAVLHLLEDGPRADVVQQAIESDDAVMSWITLGEVSSILQRRAGAEQAREVVADVRLSVDVRLPDPDLVLAAPGSRPRCPCRTPTRSPPPRRCGSEVPS
jgi:hypothetical protein